MTAAIANLNQLECVLANVRSRERYSRAWLVRSINAGDSSGRMAALEEIAIAERQAAALKSRIRVATEQVDTLRQQFAVKRIERRQIEALLDAERMRESLDANRRTQRALDDWYAAKQGETPRPAKKECVHRNAAPSGSNSKAAFDEP